MVSLMYIYCILNKKIKNQCLILFGGYPSMHKKLNFVFSKCCIKTEASELCGV